MLRVSKLTDYATVILTHIAHQPDDIHAATDITKATGIALPTVSKVLKILVKAGLVESRRGSKGGYVLQGLAVRISVADIIVAIEGPISMTQCITDKGQCEQEASCEIKGNWNLINRAVYTALEEVKLADLLESPKSQVVQLSRLNQLAKKVPQTLKMES